MRDATRHVSGKLDVAVAEVFHDGRDRTWAETGLADAAIGDICSCKSDDILARAFVAEHADLKR